jgi:hypothetical protein
LQEQIKSKNILKIPVVSGGGRAASQPATICAAAQIALWTNPLRLFLADVIMRQNSPKAKAMGLCSKSKVLFVCQIE